MFQKYSNLSFILKLLNSAEIYDFSLPLFSLHFLCINCKKYTAWKLNYLLQINVLKCNLYSRLGRVCFWLFAPLPQLLLGQSSVGRFFLLRQGADISCYTSKKMEMTKRSIENDPTAIQNDSLRFGFHGVRSEIVGNHPLQSSHQLVPRFIVLILLFQMF